MFYLLFTLIALYTLCTLAFAITSFGERCVRAGVLGSILFLIMLGLLGLYGKAEATGLLSGTAAQVSQGISALAASRSIVARRLLYWFHLLFYGKRFAWKRIPLKEEVAMPTETASWKR